MLQKTADPADVRVRVAEIPWFHTIDLGNGIVTPGVVDARDRVPRLGLPSDLSGKSVLDIGAWNGFYSFEAERRGAQRVLATDSYCWSGEGWGTKAGFELARETLGSRVEDLEIDVMDLSAEALGGRFDIVLFLGVLYHLRHPLLALEKVADVTGELLILETQVDLLDVRRPAMAFYPGAELNGDGTNWWAPNIPGMIAMLKDVGFDEVTLVTPPRSRPFRLTRALYRSLRRLPGSEHQQDRLVFHARRAR